MIPAHIAFRRACIGRRLCGGIVVDVYGFRMLVFNWGAYPVTSAIYAAVIDCDLRSNPNYRLSPERDPFNANSRASAASSEMSTGQP